MNNIKNRSKVGKWKSGASIKGNSSLNVSIRTKMVTIANCKAVQLAWLQTGHWKHAGVRNMKTKMPQMVFINTNTTSDAYLAFAADSWCWKSLSLSSSCIWGYLYFSVMRTRVTRLPEMPRGPHCSSASDEWGNGLPIYLDFGLQRPSRTEQR